MPIPSMDEAIVLRQTGGPEVLRLERVAIRSPASGEALVRVEAAGVAYAQIMMRRGEYPWAPPMPFVPGAEIVGRVVAVGEGVAAWAPGDRAVAFVGSGGYARWALARAADLVRAPEDRSAAALASLPMNYVTAWHLLHREARLAAGQTVVVHGSTGGVGTALLQLANAAGIRVLATAAKQRLGVARELGAVAIDRADPDLVARVRELTSGRGADAVLDPIGGAHLELSLRCLAPSGRLVAYGFLGAGLPEREAIAATRAQLERWNADPTNPRSSSYSLGALAQGDPGAIREALARVVELLARGAIAPIVAGELPLAQAPEAHRLLERGVVGKLVLIT